MNNLIKEVNTVLEMGLTAVLHSKSHFIAITRIEDRLFLNGLIADESLSEIVTTLQTKGYNNFTWE